MVEVVDRHFGPARSSWVEITDVRALRADAIELRSGRRQPGMTVATTDSGFSVTWEERIGPQKIAEARTEERLAIRNFLRWLLRIVQQHSAETGAGQSGLPIHVKFTPLMRELRLARCCFVEHPLLWVSLGIPLFAHLSVLMVNSWSIEILIARNILNGYGFVAVPLDPPALWRPPLAVGLLVPIEMFIHDPVVIYRVFGTLSLVGFLVASRACAATPRRRADVTWWGDPSPVVDRCSVGNPRCRKGGSENGRSVNLDWPLLMLPIVLRVVVKCSTTPSGGRILVRRHLARIGWRRADTARATSNPRPLAAAIHDTFQSRGRNSNDTRQSPPPGMTTPLNA